MVKKLSDDLKLPDGIDADAVLKAVADVEGNEELKEADAIVSAAQERLARLRKRRNKPEWVPVQLAGEDVVIKSLTLQDQIDLSLSVARDGINVLQITDEIGARAVNVAIVIACVYDEPGKRSFTKEDAEVYMDSPDAAEFMNLLLQKCLEVNPSILTTLKKT